MNGDTLVTDLLSLKLPQPAADVGSLCTVAVLSSPFASMSWAKIPCDYPMFRAGLICKKPAIKTEKVNGRTLEVSCPTPRNKAPEILLILSLFV